jgi:hypothetical protein
VLVPRPSPRRLRSVLVVGVLLALGVVVERAGWLGSLTGGRPVRQWIWAPVDLRDVRPRAFLAACDFEVASPPTSARVEVLGDEEYILWINGRRVGSSRYRDGDPLDVYDVTALLRAGRNRVLLELRSATGAGGATLRLVDSSGRVLVVTDRHWRIYASSWRGLFNGDPLQPAPAAAVLGRSPFGRWGAPVPGPVRASFDEVVTARRPRRARRYRLPVDSGAWVHLPASDQRRAPLGPLVEFDFGREVTGYLTLAARDSRTATGLLRFGATPSRRSGWAPDAVVITVPHRGSWQDAIPRRFRYVEVAGLDRVLSASLLPVDPAWLERLVPPRQPAGPLGIQGPPVRLPIADAVWRRLRERARFEPEEPATPAVRPAAAARSPAPARAPAARPRPGNPPAR